MNVKLLASLSGIVFAVLIAVGTVLGGEILEIKTSATEIAAYYGDNHSKPAVVACMVAVAAVFLAIFVASSGVLLGKASRTWAALFYGGGLILTAGWAVVAFIVLALADGGKDGLDPVVLQASNTVNTYNYLWLVVVGVLLFLRFDDGIVPTESPSS